MKSYCHLCGSTYIEGKFQPQICSKCGNLSFDNRIPVVELLLFNDNGEALIAERALDPNKGKYDIPGGFIENNENFESAAKREIAEELSLNEDDYEKPIYVESMLYTYPTKREARQLINVLFTAKLKKSDKIKASDDVASVKFVSMDELDNVDFANNYKASIIKAHKLLFG